MDKIKRRLFGAALAAAAYFAMGDARGAPPPIPPAQPYETRCLVVDAMTVEGYVTNNGPVTLQVTGPLRFSFSMENSMSRPTVQVQATVLVPPGRTVRVARQELPGAILPGESCRLDASDAVR
jgi:hypothetical protein